MAKKVFTKQDYSSVGVGCAWVCESCLDARGDVEPRADSVPAIWRCSGYRAGGDFLCEDCYQALPDSTASIQRTLIDGERGLHRDGRKPRLADMMQPGLLLEAGRIWATNNSPSDEYPEGKYPDLPGGIPNFKGGIRLTKYLDSMLRHLLALIEGQDKDPVSGFDHAGHLLCNLAMFWWTRENMPAMDDREGDADMCPRCKRWRSACERDDCLEGDPFPELSASMRWEPRPAIGPETSPGPEDPVT